MAEEEKRDELTLVVAYYDATEKARVKKITEEIMDIMSDFGDGKEFDYKEDTDDTEAQPITPRHKEANNCDD